MSYSVRIEKPDPNTLIITKVRWSRLLALLSYSAIIFFLYYKILEAPSNFTELRGVLSDSPWKWFVGVILISMLPGVVLHLRTLISADRFVFNKSDRSMFWGRDQKTSFSEIENVEIAKLLGNEAGHLYRLSVILKNGKVIRIDRSMSYEEISTGANYIADLVDVQLVRKE